MDKKTLIEDLLRVAKKCRGEMTRKDYRDYGNHSDNTLKAHFGSWNKALKMAGLDINRVMQKQREFNSDLVFAVGDKHFPFNSSFTTSAIIDDIAAEQPSVVVQLGDLYDLYSYSRFPRTHNVYTPKMELDLGRQQAENFWAAVIKAAPKATCYQLWGNHDDRAVKRILEKSPEHLHFVEQGMRELMQFDGVTTMPDSREELVINDVVYIHGYLSMLGAHARTNQRRVVCGHSHLGGVVYIKTERDILWELNAGWTGNRHAVAMGYAPQRRFSRFTTGYAKVDRYGPRFVPINAEGSKDAPA